MTIKTFPLAVASAIAGATVARFSSKTKYNHLLAHHAVTIDRYNELVEKNNSNIDRISYLATMIDESDIEVTEFDQIALTNM